MLESELSLEKSLFFFLNGSDSTFLDYFMWLYSYKFTWFPFYLCFVILFIYKYKKNWKEYILLFLTFTVLVFLCDQIASGIFKPFFERFRPTHHPDFKEQVQIVLGYRGGRYGFASSHASNVFGFAMFTSLLFRYRYYTLLIFFHALLTIYSRIYLGVHFISDVLAGALIGIIIGVLSYKIYLLCRKMLILKNEDVNPQPQYSKKEILYTMGTYIFIIATLLIANNQLINTLYKK